MSRRTSKAELEFGSDSFLDVICNMVGILIVLVVLAGVRAGKAPIVLSDAELAELVPPIVDDVSALPEPSPLPIKPIELSPELLARNRALENEVAQLRQSMGNVEPTVAELSQKEQQARVQVEAVDAQLEAARAAAQERRKEMEQLVGRLETAKLELSQLQMDVSEVQQQKSPVKTLKHKVTPVSREVNSKEVHFRLLNNRVAPVPIDDLVARLKPQIEQKKDLLVKFRQQEGEVGPVGGFSMRYVVERETISSGDAFSSSQGMMRISISKWEIVAQPELQSESIEEAAKNHSNYVRTLHMCDVNSVITLWVYPDSFEIYRKLRDIAYAEGFTVAARPIPLGIPIAGSPRGTKSSGQ